MFFNTNQEDSVIRWQNVSNNIKNIWNNNYINLFEFLCVVALSYDLYYAYNCDKNFCGFYIFNTMMIIVYIFIIIVAKIFIDDVYTGVAINNNYRLHLLIIFVILLYYSIIDYVLLFGIKYKHTEKIMFKYEMYMPIIFKVLITVFSCYIVTKNRVRDVYISFYNGSQDDNNASRNNLMDDMEYVPPNNL